jgi:hypothetical protein
VWLMPTSSTEKETGDLFGIRCPLSAAPTPAEHHNPVTSRVQGGARLASELRRRPVVQLTHMCGKAGSEHPQGPMLHGSTPLALLTDPACGGILARARYARAGEGRRSFAFPPIQTWAAGEVAATVPRNRSCRLRAGRPGTVASIGFNPNVGKTTQVLITGTPSVPIYP